MEISSHQQEGDMPMPINSAYGDGHHLIHHQHHQDPAEPHNHIINPSSSSPQPQTIIPISNNNGSSAAIAIATATAATGLQDHMVPAGGFNNSKKAQAAAAVIIRYRECLKNHAAAMGANATDGCGEFMPSGEEGSIEALKCSACNCHRNFHRKEIEGGGDDDDDHHRHHDYHNYHYVHRHHQQNMFRSGGGGGMGSSSSRKFIFGHPTATRTAGPVLPPHHHPHHMIMSYNNMGPHLPSESDEQDQDHHGGGGGGGGGTIMVRPPQLIKKRFRTKFSQEQKEKMLNFAEKVGWKIQKQEESVVQQLCQEIGVKRRVLKVWMHNNKHNLAKKTNNLPPP